MASRHFAPGRTRLRPWVQWPALLAVFALLCFCEPARAIEKLIRKPIVTDYSVSDPAFLESVSHLLRSGLIPGNKIEVLVNGDEFFPAMLKAIREAQHTVTFENFIWRSGKISTEFVTALSERARAGVQVHCVVDGFGASKLSDEDRGTLTRAGVQFEIFNPIRWYNISKWNHRTHRKLLIVDGRIGFIGGICIADEWLGNAEAPPLWRDTEFRIEGPVVAQLQGVFMDNWIRTRSEVLHGTNYFPMLEPKGESHAQCFKSGPQDGAENARLLYLYSIAAARKNIRISASYFVPDNLAIEMFLAARKRGVEIEVITPGIIDFNVVRRAAKARFGKLMEAGVKFYEYQPTKYHCKVMVVDDVWVTAGSINFDDRSFRINDESNINVWDPAFAVQQVKVFEADKAQSKALTLREYRKRGWFTRCMEQFAALFRGQL